MCYWGDDATSRRVKLEAYGWMIAVYHQANRALLALSHGDFAPGSKSIYESDFIRLDDAIAQSRGKSWRPPDAAEHASGDANRIRKKKPATIGYVGQRLSRFRSESHTA